MQKENYIHFARMSTGSWVFIFFCKENLPEMVILMNSQNRRPSDNIIWNSRNIVQDQSSVHIQSLFTLVLGLGGGSFLVWVIFFFCWAFFLARILQYYKKKITQYWSFKVKNFVHLNYSNPESLKFIVPLEPPCLTSFLGRTLLQAARQLQ